MVQGTAVSSSTTSANHNRSRGWLAPRRLLIVVAIFHLVVTVILYEVGHHGVLPATFDDDGIAVSFASDAIDFRLEAISLSDDLTRGHIREWINAVAPFHIKVYSLFFALLRPLFGATILSAEPVNASCYLLILVLVFYLGKETFDRRVGLIAAATVAVWPSFLLHSTQLLRDPLFLVGMLAFILVNVHFLSRMFSWSKALLAGASGGLITAFIWLVRDTMMEILIATAGLAGAMLIARQIWETYFMAGSEGKHFATGNRVATLVGMAFLILMTVGVTRIIPGFDRPKNTHYGADVTPAHVNVGLHSSDGDQSKAQSLGAKSLNPLTRFAARVAKARRQFVVEYPGASSNIDSDRQFDSTTDLVRYLPRAVAIGFFAPFPRMWWTRGDQVGSMGKLFSGLETLALYLIEVLALVGLWRGRRRFGVWFLGLESAMGLAALGLVVINVGALYRLRYAFVILLIILAAAGIDKFRNRLETVRFHRGTTRAVARL